MAIVSCPECSKKLKVADTSVGKKVKCSCGNVFVASTDGAAAVTAPAAGDKVVVACTECGAKLKVGAASLGKKMKCPKCAAVFVAAEDAPTKAAPKPPPEPEPELEEDEFEEHAPKKKAKAVNDEDMEDLLSFAENDAKEDDSPFQDEDEEEAKPKKAKHADDDDDIPVMKPSDEDEDEPKPKSKAAQRGAPPPRYGDDKPEKPVYPSRTFLNVFVFFLLFLFVGGFAVVFLVYPPKLGELKDDSKRRQPVVQKDDLEGTWIVDSAEADGKARPQVVGEKFVFANDKLNAPDLKDATYLVDNMKDPRWIEIAGEKGPLSGIYKIEDDVLHLCLAPPKVVLKEGKPVIKDGKPELEPGERPTKFESAKASLLKLKREKKADDADKDAKEKDADKDKSKDQKGEKDKDKGKDKKKEIAARIEGTWIVESSTWWGQKNNKMVGQRVVFADGKFTGVGQKPSPYTVNVDRDPMELDLHEPVRPGFTKILPGIFKFDGDKLNYCYSMNPKVRPKDFNFDDLGGLLILRRAAKTDTSKNDATYSRSASANNLKVIGLGIHTYHDHTKQVPPAAGSAPYDKSYKPLLSWRVAILPHIEQETLFKEFDLTKPWDDAHNKKLIAKMPKVYMVPGVSAKEGMTHYRTLVTTPFRENGGFYKGTRPGPVTLLDPLPGGAMLGTTYRLYQVPDGASNVIMAVEATEPTIWTKPDDLPYNPDGPLPKFGVVSAGFNVLLADATIKFVPATVPDKVLRTWLTCNNNQIREPLTPEDKDTPTNKENPFFAGEITETNARLAQLTSAVRAFIKVHKRNPKTLKELLELDFLKGMSELEDVWHKPFQYDSKGPKNKGKEPDIWTLTPNKEVIGNWMANTLHDMLNGTWIVEQVKTGVSLDEKLKGDTYVFADGKVTMGSETASYIIDATKSPFWITVTVPAPPDGKPIVWPGIFGFEGLKGNELRLAFPAGSGPELSKRPNRFDEVTIRSILLRQKDKDGKKGEKDKGNDKDKAAIALAHVNVLTVATKAYWLRNDDVFPQTLDMLLEKTASGGPYLESKDALIDPWNQPYRYDPSGKRNNGRHPDIWTVGPDQQLIGNWPAEKSKAKDGKSQK